MISANNCLEFNILYSDSEPRIMRESLKSMHYYSVSAL